jgi:hypothetical protein
MTAEKDPHVLGTKAPEGGHTANEGGKYEHWMEKELKSMEKMGEHSSDERAFRSGRAGMEGKKSPKFEIEERERGDASAKARPAAERFEEKEFDVNQFDRGDERRPSRGRKEEY